MPSNLDLPSIEELRQSFHNAVRGRKESKADDHAGSAYDHFAGATAIVWSWQAQRDKDQFESIYFDRATGQELTDYVAAHDGIDRILDSAGEGYIEYQRPSTAAGAGTFYKGTRILYYQHHTSVQYEVLEDTDVDASTTELRVPIKASFFGRNSELNVSGLFPTQLKIADPLWDNTWVPLRIVCGPGTLFEQAAEYRARVREQRRKQRVGYPDRILQVCKDQGAKNVFLLPSDFGGDSLDYGINVVYVGDEGFNTTTELRYKVTVALEAVRVLGADVQVLPMNKATQPFKIVLHTWTNPNNLNSFEIRRTAVAYILDYFRSSTTGYSFDLNQIGGLIRKRLSDVIKSVEITTPSSSVGILNGGVLRPVLTKYEVQEKDILITLSGT